MKKILFFILLLMLSCSVALAAEIQETTPVLQDPTTDLQKPSISVIYIDNSSWPKSQSAKQKNRAIILGDIIEKYSPKYNIYHDQRHIDKMVLAGFRDFSSAERDDILSVYQDSADYVVAITIQAHSTFMPYVHLKIIDVKNKKNLFSGLLNTYDSWLSHGSYRYIHNQIDTQMLNIFLI
ncbi:hypothetical protein [Anaerospora sp.]|uniref:hypothetical protein n=1 Tax=Anaerospora sp. TaxID=1960278 RepID=UPI00289A61B3|nr:hypothetical protein [Anaerospora sp.]